MRPLSDQDHYEVLEVPRSATAEELERAYQLARATYEDDSLAGYSLFDPGDARAIRERMDLAYRVLSDHEARRAYDASLGAVGESGAPAWQAEPDEGAEPEVAPALPPAPALEHIEDYEEETGEFDGPRLRRSRLRCGLEIEDVAKQTKVNPTYLRFLEEERFAELPARVYVRGFVMAYATCLGLDSRAVAGSYLQRFDAVHPRGRGRLSKGG